MGRVSKFEMKSPRRIPHMVDFPYGTPDAKSSTGPSGWGICQPQAGPDSEGEYAGYIDKLEAGQMGRLRPEHSLGVQPRSEHELMLPSIDRLQRLRRILFAPGYFKSSPSNLIPSTKRRSGKRVVAPKQRRGFLWRYLKDSVSALTFFQRNYGDSAMDTGINDSKWRGVDPRAHWSIYRFRH